MNANKGRRSITTKDTIKVMREHGIEVSESEAAEILDFLYFLAEITVKQYIKDSNGGENLQ